MYTFKEGDLVSFYDFKDYCIDNPEIRIGQMFSILFIKNDEDVIYNGLWESDGAEAWGKIHNIIYRLQWDYVSLRVVRSVK